MRKFVNCYFLMLITLSALLFTACNDDDNYSGPSPDKVTARYSNKLAPGLNTLPLELTYSGRDFYGNEVYLDTSDGVTGTLSLFGVFAGEEQTDITGVTLNGSGDKYSFSGNATSNKGTTFKYDGEVTEKGLVLNLSDVQVSSNELSQQGQYDLVPFGGTNMNIIDGKMVMASEVSSILQISLKNPDVEAFAAITALNGIGSNLLSNIISSTIKNIQFKEDGNVQATYSSLPEGFMDNIQEYVFGPNSLQNRPDDEWSTSDLNLAHYYIKDGELFIVLNIEMIIREVQANNSRDVSLSDILSLLTSYPQITNLVNDGIKLNVKTEFELTEMYGGAYYTTYEGNVELLIDEKVASPLLNLLPLISLLLPEDVLTGDLGGIDLEYMFTTLMTEIAKNTETFELGIFLY